ncbi:MAG: BamA/TamA family outer membrane protein [Bacteroidota bacterium]|nr:BamA/TamA family outer membrane protein [Bacteroidota bacterium]
MKIEIKYNLIYLLVKLIVVGAVLSFWSCNPARHLGDDEYLLKRNKIHIEGKPENLEINELENYIKQESNTRILGIFPFHLRVYNFLNIGKERKYKEKLKKVIGEEPVIFNDYLSKKTVKQLLLYVHSKGYYNAIVKDTVKFNRKKAKVFYTIIPNKPYRIRNVNYSISDSIVHNLVLEDSTTNILLHPGGIFDFDILEDERDRITKVIRNKGYYAFSKDFIDYLVDSALASKQVEITIRIKLYPTRKEGKKLVAKPHSKFNIRNINLYIDLNQKQIKDDSLQVFAPTDTLKFENIHFYYRDKLRIKPAVLLSKIHFKNGKYFSEEDIDQTYRNLSALQQFRLVNIQFEEIPDSLTFDSSKYLDCHIQLTSMVSQSYQVELEGTNSSNHWGIGGNLLYSHRNLFGGAEMFDVKFSGALEVQRNFVSSSTENFLPNTFEYGVETKITFPKFWIPFNAGRVLRKYHPKTAMSFRYNHQKRTDYTRTLLNAGFGYKWNSDQFHKHLFNPIELNVINLSDTSSAFSQYFDTLYLKHSYESQFISASSYSYEFSNQNLKRKRNFIFIRSRIETAGNIINLSSMIAGSKKTDGDYYELFNNHYAQYIRSDVDFRFYKYMSKHSLLVYRGFIGVGIPYGNSKVLPFVKKYFSGGANGIRAWQIRSLGPGSFKDASSFPDLAADMKIEANIEYRFDVIWMLKAAFFVDVGNIWAINKYDDRTGALFRFDSFYKEIAIGTGVGARFDFDFLLFRIDLGIKVRDPELPQGTRMIWGNRKLGVGDYSWNFGIGYPF